MDTELVEGSEVRAEGSETREESNSKRAGDELEQEKAKNIVDYKIIKEGKISYFQIIRVDKMKKKDQISFDEQDAIRLQAEFDEDVRLAREKYETNVALIEKWNDIQDKIEIDY
ncbi:hypothetical protein Tco_0166788, partial [Tanacetum coccineum]